MHPKNQPQPVSRTRFWLTWMGWNALGMLVSLLLQVFVLSWFSQLVSSLDPQSNFLPGLASILVAVLAAVAIGWSQQHALRAWLVNRRSFFFATTLGYLLVILTTGSGTYLSFIQQNMSTFNTYSQAHIPEMVILSVIAAGGGGLMIALFQWLVLRLEYRRAGRWVAWPAVGWLLYYVFFTGVGMLINQAATTNPALPSFAIQVGAYYLLFLFYPAASGFGLIRLLQPAGEPAESEEGGQEESLRGRLVLRWALATGTALLVNHLLVLLGLATFFSTLFPPAVVAGQGQVASLAGTVLPFVVMGLILGAAQVWALGADYRQRWIWAAATLAAFILQGLLIQGQVLAPVLQWAGTSFTQSPGFFSAYIVLLAGSLSLWLAVGILQAAALWRWAGPPAWMWLLVVPVLQIIGLLSAMLLGDGMNVTLAAVAGGVLLAFFLRGSWSEVLVLVPQGAPFEQGDLEQAAEVLRGRLTDSFGINGQVVVEDGSLVASFSSKGDVEDCLDLATRPGLARIVEAVGTLVTGNALPKGLVNLLEGDDIISASATQDVLELSLAEESGDRLAAVLAKRPSARLALALDGEVVGVFAPDPLQPAHLLIPGLETSNARFLAGILNNDPMPLALVQEQEED